MMVLIPTSNPNEDSQGTQLRVNKKLATVCSGVRSRFSKPRPNLAISKRGESNASVSKSSKSSGEVVQTIINSNTDTNKKVVEDDAKIISIEDDIKKPVSKGINEVISSSNIKKSSPENIFEVPSNSNVEILDSENVINKLPNTNTEKLPSDGDNRIIPPTDVEKRSSNEENRIISSPELEKSVSKENTADASSSHIKVLNLEDVIPSFSNANVESPLKVPESERKSSPNIAPTAIDKSNAPTAINKSNASTVIDKSNAPTVIDKSNAPTVIDKSNAPTVIDKSNAPTVIDKSNAPTVIDKSNAPTVIDKSKYPHLTSILSKKRTEPRKEAQQKRRKKFKKGDAPPERSKMTMADLIYWNPVKTDESQKSAVIVNETSSDNVVVEEESVDDVDENENNVLDSVPKLVISEDGQINIDQSSLFVSRNISQPKSTEVIRKDDTTYSSFRKRPLTKHWTAKDTANFYRALSLVGADFSLMEQIFPNRTRRELKHKFKREERMNIDIINKVLYESQTFDEMTLNDFIDENSTIDDPVPLNEKEDTVKDKSRKQRTSKKESLTERRMSESSHLEEETENEKNDNSKRKGKKIKKSSDDEDVEISIPDLATYINADERSGSRRKRNVKKLPDDFVSLDSIDDLDIFEDYETNSDQFEETSVLIQQDSNDFEMENSAGEIPSESACAILDKNINETDTTGIQQNLQEETTNLTVPLPLVINNNIFEETSVLIQQNSNDFERENSAEEIPSESACIIFDKIINGAETTDIQQNLQEETTNLTVPLPLVINDSEEYISVEYIKNGDSDVDLAMLRNVMAYEVVNTQIPGPKRKRKINPSVAKNRQLVSTTDISPPTNYTNYTPV